MIPASVIVVAACVVLLVRSDSPGLATGVFVLCKVGLAFFLGQGLVSVLLHGVVLGLLAFGWFWLLDRLQGSAWWWLALFVGLLFLV
jgi:hypothetical protein